MTRHLFPAILIGVLAVPVAAGAQHTNGGGAPSTGTAVSSAPAPAPAPAPSSSSSGSPSSSGGSATASGPSGDSGQRRGNLPATGRAVPRGTVPGSGGSGTVIIDGSGFYPWGYAYGGAIGLDGGYYGGYYGAYDPWYGWFPTYAPASYGGGPDNTGALRLKVKPSDASVYVDGFYVGVVDDFDNSFQRLKLEPGPHHIEIRSQEYQPLSVDVMIQEDFTITYRGEMIKR